MGRDCSVHQNQGNEVHNKSCYNFQTFQQSLGTTTLAQPKTQPTNQPTNQSTNQPTNQPTFQPTNQPTNQPIQSIRFRCIGAVGCTSKAEISTRNGMINGSQWQLKWQMAASSMVNGS
jgi:hypothetical protein